LFLAGPDYTNGALGGVEQLVVVFKRYVLCWKQQHLYTICHYPMVTMKVLFPLSTILALLLVISLVSAASVMPVKCDGSEATNQFHEGESLCVYGTGFTPDQEVDIYVVKDQDSYVGGQELNDLSGGAERSSITPHGILILQKVWDWLVQGVYDLVVDINLNGKYDDGDVVNAVHHAITVTGNNTGADDVEEVPEWSMIGVLIILLVSVIVIMHHRRGV